MILRPIKSSDIDPVLQLYLAVAGLPGGLARMQDEIDRDYIAGFVHQTLAEGLGFVAEDETGDIVGEIHAYSPGLFCFSHVLSQLTIAVHPKAQGQGVGRSLFEALMAVVRDNKDILRVELLTRESNHKAIAFYCSLGFVQEGEFQSRVKSPDGSLESDIPMAWVRSAS